MARVRQQVDISVNVPKVGAGDNSASFLTRNKTNSDIWEVDATNLPQGLTPAALTEIQTLVRQTNNMVRFQHKFLVDFVERQVSGTSRYQRTVGVAVFLTYWR